MARAVDLVFTTSKRRFRDLLLRSGAPLVVAHQEPSTPPFTILTLQRVGPEALGDPTEGPP
jgi:hypothetical protein